MPSRFRRGAAAYTKDGRRYTVEDIDDGIVYCVSDAGAETDFPETSLMTEAEWSGRSAGRPDLLYSRIKQSWAGLAVVGKPDRAASAALLGKLDRLSPVLLDFTAFTLASRLLHETKSADFIAELSIKKCREIFQSLNPENRLGLVAKLLGTTPALLLSAGQLRDNLISAMVEKGLASCGASLDEFADRRRQ